MAGFDVTSLLVLLVSFQAVLYVQSVPSLQSGTGFLQKYGYMSPPDPNAAQLISEIDLRQAIMNMQRFLNLPETGQMDEATVRMMQRPRCGRPDIEPRGWSNRNRRRGKRYLTAGIRWEKYDLTYSFDNYTPDLSNSQTRDAIQRAFQVWRDVTPLTFREIRGGNPDIHIKFSNQIHGDDYPFDGSGGTLAHAFFPGEGLGGDAHFDEDETFTFAKHEGINLFTVAAHELGHSLGLGHSDVEGALMAPYYQGYNPYFQLAYDDIAGVQSLYGPNQWPRPPQPRPRPTTLPTTQQPETPEPTSSPTCTGGFQAVSDIRGELFIFKGDQMWRLASDGSILSGYPMPTRTFWGGAPSDVDAVHEKLDGTIIFMKDSKYWEFNGLDLKSGFPQDISYYTNVELSEVDSTLALREEAKTYFFKGDQCWRYDGMEMRMDDGYPKKIKDEWSGGPDTVDAAFRFDDATILVQGNKYWKYSKGSMTADSTEPRWFTVDFLECDEDTVPVPTTPSSAPRSVYGLWVGVLSTLMALILYR